MEKLRKTIYDVLVFIASLCIAGSISVSNVKTKDASHINLTVDESSQQQEITGWAPPEHGGRRSRAQAITPRKLQSCSSARMVSGSISTASTSAPVQSRIPTPALIPILGRAP